MPDASIGIFTSKYRTSVSTGAALFFVICCAMFIGADLLRRAMEIFVLHYKFTTWSVYDHLQLLIEDAGFGSAAYRMWLESKCENRVPTTLLPVRPVGVRLFARFQSAFAAILFLLIVFRTIFSSPDTSTSMHVVTVWWDLPSSMTLGAAFACIAAFLGYYAWNGSKGTRDAILILSAAEVMCLLIWWALWLAGTIPPPSDNAAVWDRPFFPKEAWLATAWGAVNIWYFGISRARKFYTT